MKRVIWIGSAKKDLQQQFSKMARKEAGYQIYRLQEGFDPKDWKPLHGMGPGVREIRIHAENEYRIIYSRTARGGIVYPSFVREENPEDSPAGSRVGSRKIESGSKGGTCMKPEWEEGSENIFMDLGFSETEADHLMIRSRLMLEVERFVERSKLSQREAAKKLGVTQPRLNDLLQGKIQKFSIDALVKMLSKVGIHVDVNVSAA